MGVLNLLQRFVVAAIAIPVVVFCIKIHELLIIITTILTIAGLYELHGITNRTVQLLFPPQKNDVAQQANEIATPSDPTILRDVHYYLDVLMALGMTYISYFHSSNLGLLLCMIIFTFFGIFSIDMLLFNPFGQSDEQHMKTFIKIFLRTFSVVYIGMGFSGALMMVQQHRLLLIVTLFDNWASDAMALFFGKNLGRYKLHRYLSPNKTMEGGFGAVFGAVLTSLLFYVVNYRVYDLHAFFDQPHHTLGSQSNGVLVYVVYGVILGLLGIVGDLIESYLKRIAKVKDSGSFFGAHGGVLDRIDGLLFSFPIIYMINQFVL